MSAARRWWIPALATCLCVAALRIWLAGSLELHEDEAWAWLRGGLFPLSVSEGLPGAGTMARAGTLLLGTTERGVRLVPVLITSLAAMAIALDARDRALTLLAALAMPGAFLIGTLATPAAALIACWPLGVLAATRGRWALVGLAGGLSCVSSPFGALLLPLLLIADRPPARDIGRALVAMALPCLPALMGSAVGTPLTDLLAPITPGDTSLVDRVFFQGSLAGPLLPVLMAWWAVGNKGDPIERRCWWVSAPCVLLALLAPGTELAAAPAWIVALMGVSRRTGVWTRSLSVGAGLSVLASLLVALQIASPFIDIPVDPRNPVAGGRTIGESVRAWGQPEVWTETRGDAALIRFYGDVPARPLPGTSPIFDRALGTDLADSALFVRIWRATTPPPTDDLGFERGPPNVVTAYIETSNPLIARPVARWQVYEVRRAAP